MALVLAANPDRMHFARAVEAGASGALHKSTLLKRYPRVSADFWQARRCSALMR